MSQARSLRETREYKKSQEYLDQLNTIPWTLDQALTMIRQMQDTAWDHGYHLCLSGGVLNKGESYNDLDIVCLPGTAEKHYYKSTLVSLMAETFNLESVEILSLGNKQIWKFIEKDKLTRRKVDFIFIQSI